MILPLKTSISFGDFPRSQLFLAEVAPHLCRGSLLPSLKQVASHVAGNGMDHVRSTLKWYPEMGPSASYFGQITWCQAKSISWVLALDSLDLLISCSLSHKVVTFTSPSVAFLDVGRRNRTWMCQNIVIWTP